MILSIIIPVYNTEENILSRCLNSIIENSSKNYEIILIDDGSDLVNSLGYQRLCKKNKKIRYVYIKNAGPSNARNVGVSIASGDYIVFVDSDDIVSYNFVEDVNKILSVNKVDLIIGLVCRVSNNINYSPRRSVNNKNQELEMQILSGESRKLLLDHVIGEKKRRFTYNYGYFGDGPVSRVVKTSIAKRIFFNNRLIINEDTVWNIQLFHFCETIIAVNRQWYFYIMNDSSITHKYRESVINDYICGMEMQLAEYKKYWGGKKNGCYNSIFRYLGLVMQTFFCHKDNKKSFYENFCLFKNCISQKVVQETLHNVDFEFESRWGYKIFKYLLVFLMKRNLTFVSFCFFKILYLSR